jgi:hypothetical protein
MRLQHIFIEFNVSGFESLGPQPDFIADALSFPERLELDTVELSVMEKYVLAAIITDEAKATVLD